MQSISTASVKLFGKPQGKFFYDKDGHHRREEARLRWWDPEATTFRSAALGMDGREAELPEDPIPTQFGYRDPALVLFGHYWMGANLAF